ncbi:MAG TPA: hypothetical protein VGC25_02100 [Alphaproteobacteria bacterium]
MTDEPPKAEQVEDTSTQAEEVTEDELKAAFGGPAIHSNKVYVSLLPMGARLAFMEQLREKVPPTFRAAVFLNIPDVLALRDLLNRILKNVTLEIVTKPKQEDGD